MLGLRRSAERVAALDTSVWRVISGVPTLTLHSFVPSPPVSASGHNSWIVAPATATLYIQPAAPACRTIACDLMQESKAAHIMFSADPVFEQQELSRRTYPYWQPHIRSKITLLLYLIRYQQSLMRFLRRTVRRREPCSVGWSRESADSRCMSSVTIAKAAVPHRPERPICKRST